MTKITTSVDSLVNLVKKKGRISVEEASKTLKLSPEVVMEWANFLEEDKIVLIEYKLTTPFLLDYALKHKHENTSKLDIELYQTSIKNIINFLKRSSPEKLKESELKKRLLKQKQALNQECTDYLTTIMTPDASKTKFEKINKHLNIYKKTLEH